MTTPGDGFEYGEDQVTARLSVEIPPEAIRSLDDVAQRTEDLRVNMEAVAKATADYGDYLTSIPALGAEAQNRQGNFVSRNVDRLIDYEPAGLPDWQVAAGQQQLSELAQSNPRQFANVMAQRGNDPEWDDQSYIIDRGTGPLPAPRSRRESGNAGTGPSGRDDSSRPPGRSDNTSVDWLEILRENQERTTSTVTRVLGELALGGRANALQTASGLAGSAVPGLTSFSEQMTSRAQAIEAENAQMIQQYAEENGVDIATASAALQGAGALQGMRLPSLAGGISGGMVKGAGLLGVAAGGFAAFQGAGNQYQDFRAQGLQRGGGAMEGLAFEMGVRTMAMNPFIDVEQSRRIMQTALNEGYTGREMETVTQFMTENLVQMNLTAQESAKILRENVQRGGQSLEAAQQDAQAAGLMAQNENAMRTSGEFQETWQSSTATAIASGAGGQQASQLGLAATGMFAEDPVLGDLSGQIVQGMANNPAMGMALGQASGYRGSPGGALAYILNQSGGDRRAMQVWAQQVEGIARRLAPMLSNEHSKFAGLQAFMAQVRSTTGLNLSDIAQAEALAGMAIRGELMTEVDRVFGERERTLSGGDVEQVGQFEGMGRTAAALGHGAMYAWHGLAGGLASVFGSDESSDSITRMRDESYQRMRQNFQTSPIGSYGNARIDELMGRYGSGNIRVQRNGEVEDINNLDEGQIRDIVSGKARISINGGEWTTLEDESLMEGVGNTAVGGQFDLTEDARKLLRLIPDDVRSQHQRNVDANVRGYNANQPPPGESFGIGGR